jgi:hypothetical protein
VWQFARLASAEKVIFSLAFALLGVGRLMVWLRLFRRPAVWFGGSPGHSGYSHLLVAEQLRQAEQIGRLVRLAARHTPWQSKCLVQAVAARTLLCCRRIPSTVYLGVAKSPLHGMQAHAWVTAGSVHVTGNDGSRNFTTIAAFTSRSFRSTAPGNYGGRR